MLKYTSLVLAFVILLTMLACGGGKQALISQSEINNARQSGQLSSLYNKITKIINESSGSAKKEAINLRSNIVKLLIEDKTNQVNKVLSQYNQEQREQQQFSVTRKSLNELNDSITGMQEWSATDHARLSPRINKALSQVNNQIQQLIAESGQQQDLVASVSALEKAAKLAGEGQPEGEQFAQAREKALSQLVQQGSDSLSQRLYRGAITAAEQGLQIDPGNIQFESMLSQSQAGLFEKDFRAALEQGKPESAYQSMIEVADKPIFLQLKKSMGKSILLLANYFSGTAQKAYSAGDYYAAYQNFTKGRTIQQKLDVSKPGFIQEKQFLDLLMQRARQTDLAEGNRQSIMRVVREFDANYPGLSTDYMKLSDDVKKRALTKLSVAEFKEVPSGNSVIASVGRRVGSKLEKILFDKLGNEVQIVANIVGNQGQGYEGLALQIDGEILQAAIENTSNQGRRTQNVQTGVDRVETEEYKKWSKRKRGDAPTRYHETPKHEDVELIVEHIRKQSIAEVAFRVIEPASGNILLTDNVVKDSEFSGESINEFQKGDFHQPYVRADLPSDIKIMDDLSSELADILGDKLAKYLQSPEQVFYQKASDAKAQGDSVAAIELLANAVAISEAKGQDFSAWYAELKELALTQK